MWDVVSGAHLQVFKGHIDGVISTTFSSDGKVMASLSGDDTVVLWDVPTATRLHTLAKQTEHAHTLAFSPDGKLLVTDSSRGAISLWNVANGTELQVLTGHISWVRSFVFSTDGATLTTGSYGGTILVWDISSQISSNTTDVSTRGKKPVTLGYIKATQLLQNYPNPFNPETWIPYHLITPADVRIAIYTSDGKLVRALDLGHQFAGIYQERSRAAHWNGKNAQGEPVASGVYFYTFSAGKFTATRKMLIRK